MTTRNRLGGKLKIFLNLRVYKEAELRIIPSPKAQKEARAWNFSKSQGPYRYGSAKNNTSTYFFIFLHMFDIFLRIFHILLHILPYFLHIPSYLLHQGIPECDVIRGEGCTRKS